MDKNEIEIESEYEVVWDGRGPLTGDPVAAVEEELKIAESKTPIMLKRQRQSDGLRRYYRNHPEQRKKIAAAVKKHWTSGLTPEERAERGRQISKGKRTASAQDSTEQRRARHQRQVEARRKQWKTQRDYPGVIASRTQKMLQTMSRKTPAERQAIRSKRSESMKSWKRSRTEEEVQRTGARIWAARRAHYGSSGAP